MANIQTLPLDYKPSGDLAGLYNGIQASQISQANQGALAQQDLDTIVKQNQAAQAQDEMNNPEYRDWRLKGMTGDAKGKAAAGDLAWETMPSNAKAKIAENVNKASKEELEGTLRGLDTFISQASASGPAGISVAMQNLPPEYQKAVGELVKSGKDPVQYAQQFRDLITQAQSHTPTSVAAERMQSQKDESHYITSTDVAEEHSRSAELVARIHAAAQRDAAAVRKGDEKAAERVQHINEVANGVITDPKLTQEAAKSFMAAYVKAKVDVASASAEKKIEGTAQTLERLGVGATKQKPTGTGTKENPIKLN